MLRANTFLSEAETKCAIPQNVGLFCVNNVFTQNGKASPGDVLGVGRPGLSILLV